MRRPQLARERLRATVVNQKVRSLGQTSPLTRISPPYQIFLPGPGELPPL